MQAFRNLLFPEDQQKELSDQEVYQEIIRSNHLAKLTMKNVANGIKKHDETLMEEYEEMHSKSVE